jgi:AcrR family transcriptional regulator
MSTTDEKPMRADARRNRDAILASAGALFAERGSAVQMDEIAEHTGLGMGTLYRHFPTKRALLAAIVGERFRGMTELARAAAQIADPADAFEALLRTYLEAADRDAAFRLAVLGPERPDWDALIEQKNDFVQIAGPIMTRAAAAGHLRADFTITDFVLVTRGVMANMTPDGNWRRHLELTLQGLR